MDAGSLIHNSKNRKLNEEQDMNRSSSNLDDLPDPILQHILSLIPTKNAVSTSILSKRWRYLWTSIPNLEFHQGYRGTNRGLFMNFVERVLLFHDLAYVEKFSLKCDVLDDASRINAWISTAVRRKVQKVDIHLSNDEEPFMLPHCLFTCDSLTELNIWMYCILVLPSSICFSSLKNLTLTSITFPDDDSTQRLFSSCPVLEVLNMMYCHMDNLEALTISAPKLQKLTIDEFDMVNESGSNGCQVMIFGSSLKSFTYIGELINDYCLYDSSSLVMAWINVLYWGHRSREIAYRATKLLKELSNVNDLILSKGAIDVLNNAEELFEHLPMFNNLTELEFSVILVDFNCKSLLKILQNSPHLRSLAFGQGIKISKSVGKDDWILDPMPPCFSSHLKIIEVHAFSGKEEELCAIKILLKNAIVLDRMDIFCSKALSGDLERRKKAHEQLLTLPRRSMSCSIVLS